MLRFRKAAYVTGHKRGNLRSIRATMIAERQMAMFEGQKRCIVHKGRLQSIFNAGAIKERELLLQHLKSKTYELGESAFRAMHKHMEFLQELIEQRDRQLKDLTDDQTTSH